MTTVAATQDHAPEETPAQYSLAKILGIWAAAALPMAILGWVVFPAVSPDFKADPLGAGVTRLVLLTVGLIWLFVLSMIFVYRDEGDLRWATIRRRLWLNTLRDPTNRSATQQALAVADTFYHFGYRLRCLLNTSAGPIVGIDLSILCRTARLWRRHSPGITGNTIPTGGRLVVFSTVRRQRDIQHRSG